jgi:hypothetical protein
MPSSGTYVIDDLGHFIEIMYYYYNYYYYYRNTTFCNVGNAFEIVPSRLNTWDSKYHTNSIMYES